MSTTRQLTSGRKESVPASRAKGVKVTIGGKKVKGAIELSELGNPTNLRELHVVISRDNEAYFPGTMGKWNETLSGIRNLKTLGINAQNFSNGLHTRGDCTARESERAVSQNYDRNKLPGWINPLKLPNLEYLCSEGTKDVEEWKPPAVVWGVLQGVRLKDMNNLEADWGELKSKMPALMYLEVIKCHGLINLPKDIKDGIWRAKRQRT